MATGIEIGQLELGLHAPTREGLRDWSRTHHFCDRGPAASMAFQVTRLLATAASVRAAEEARCLWKEAKPAATLSTVLGQPLGYSKAPSELDLCSASPQKQWALGNYVAQWLENRIGAEELGWPLTSALYKLHLPSPCRDLPPTWTRGWHTRSRA